MLTYRHTQAYVWTYDKILPPNRGTDHPQMRLGGLAAASPISKATAANESVVELCIDGPLRCGVLKERAEIDVVGHAKQSLLKCCFRFPS